MLITSYLTVAGIVFGLLAAQAAERDYRLAVPWSDQLLHFWIPGLRARRLAARPGTAPGAVAVQLPGARVSAGVGHDHHGARLDRRLVPLLLPRPVPGRRASGSSPATASRRSRSFAAIATLLNLAARVVPPIGEHRPRRLQERTQTPPSRRDHGLDRPARRGLPPRRPRRARREPGGPVAGSRLIQVLDGQVLARRRSTPARRRRPRDAADPERLVPAASRRVLHADADLRRWRCAARTARAGRTSIAGVLQHPERHGDDDAVRGDRLSGREAQAHPVVVVGDARSPGCRGRRRAPRARRR